MKTATIRTLITGLAICLGTNAIAEDGPSYEETVDYIVQRAWEKENYEQNTLHIEAVEFPERCKIYAYNKNVQNGKVTHHFSYEADLKDFDPMEISEFPNGVGISIRVFNRSRKICPNLLIQV